MSTNDYPTETKTLDLRKIIKNYWNYRLYFIILGIIALTIAYFVNKTADRIYRNSTTFSIEDNSDSKLLTSNDFFRGLGISGNNQMAENELATLSSFSLCFNTISKLDLSTSYFLEEKIFSFLPLTRSINLYKDSPYTVIINNVYPQAIDVHFYIEILNENEFIIKALGENVRLYNYIENEIDGGVAQIAFKKKFKFGEQIKTDFLDIKIIAKDTESIKQEAGKVHYFVFNNLKYLTRRYQYSLEIESNLDMNTIIRVSLEGTNYKLIHDFLNEYTKTYLNQNLQKKNDASLSTINFIDEQISLVSDTLSQVERRLQLFRSRHQVTDLSYQGEQLLLRITELEKEKSQIDIQIKYYNYLNNYFKEKSDLSDLVMPSVMGANDPVLNNLIEQVLEANAERIKLLDDDNTKNLYLRNVEVQLNNLKTTIVEYIKNNMKTLVITKQDLEEKIYDIEKELRLLPGTERELFGIERQFKLNDAVYTYLLEKRAEAQIIKASNKSDIEIIDPAMTIYPIPLRPKTKFNYVIALAISLLIIVVIVIIKDFFNNKIREQSDIYGIGSTPVVGNINLARSRGGKLLSSNLQESILAESFRDLKTNLHFFESNKPIQTILITSTFSGEGKTFIARNLAKFLTENQKKVVLIDFDLRKPDMHKHFELNNDLGNTSFLINSVTINEIINETNFPNLDLITAGPIAPNPSELIASDNVSNMLEILQDTYDYVVIDTTPAGIISDTLLLMQKADLNLFTVRLNHSETEITNKTIKHIQSKKIPNFCMIINGVDKKTEAYKYKYGKKYFKEQ